MSIYNAMDKMVLERLFENFVDAGLHGRFEEALELIEEPYIGVGMGEQGIVRSKEHAELVLRGGYRADNEAITCDIGSITVNFLSDDVAVIIGQVDIVNTPKSGDIMYSGLMQTIGARRRGRQWSIAFTHASPAMLTVESVEAYPIRFMDHTMSLLKAGLQAETVLYAEVNLTQNTVKRLECKAQNWPEKPCAKTLEEAVRFGLYGSAAPFVESEYYNFWDRLRLLGLFAEGVSRHSFDYRMCTEHGEVCMRSSVEMVRQSYSGDIVAVISYSSLEDKKTKQEHASHGALIDRLTGVLNREGFEQHAAELLQNCVPENNTALFMIDLDDFKQINDRLGHQTGDAVLHQVGEVLQNTFRSSDAVGRVGGDEFMVLITGDFTCAFLEEKADELLGAMKLSVGESKQIPVSISIGVAYGSAGSAFEKLYGIADISLYTAKKAGKCRYHLINADTNAEKRSSRAVANLVSLQSLLDYTEEYQFGSDKAPYNALLENIPGGVVVLEITDTTVKITHCNSWFGRILGVSDEDVDIHQLENPLFYVHPDDIELITCAISKIREGADSFKVVYRIRHKDGHYKHVAMAASATERCRGSVIMYGIGTDMEDTVRP